jgi:hypothetical protein
VLLRAPMTLSVTVSHKWDQSQGGSAVRLGHAEIVMVFLFGRKCVNVIQSTGESHVSYMFYREGVGHNMLTCSERGFGLFYGDLCQELDFL